jgi:hypothetical protein
MPLTPLRIVDKREPGIFMGGDGDLSIRKAQDLVGGKRKRDDALDGPRRLGIPTKGDGFPWLAFVGTDAVMCIDVIGIMEPLPGNLSQTLLTLKLGRLGDASISSGIG